MAQPNRSRYWAWTARELLELVERVEGLELVACYRGFDLDERVELGRACGRVLLVLRRA